MICLGIFLAIDVLKPNVDEVALRCLCALIGSLEICMKRSNAQQVSEKAARVIDLSAAGATYAADVVLAGHLMDHKLRVSLHKQAADALTLGVLQPTDPPLVNIYSAWLLVLRYSIDPRFDSPQSGSPQSGCRSRHLERPSPHLPLPGFGLAPPSKWSVAS